MPGVEILANVIDSARPGITVAAAAPYQNLLLNLGAMLCALAGFASWAVLRL